MQEFLDKYKWFIEELNKVEKEVKRKVFRNMSRVKKNFFPEGEYKADIDNLINCALCPNLCRFDCGTLQAAQKESMSPGYKSKIGYYLSIGKIDPTNLSHYIAYDGYAGLAKVLADMNPEEVIDQVERAGLRGRGGAG